VSFRSVGGGGDLAAWAHRLTDAEIVGFNGKKASRREVLAVGVEALNRGMLPRGEQVKLAAMLDEEVAGLEEQRDRASWRRRFPYLDEEEIAVLRQAGGGR